MHKLQVPRVHPALLLSVRSLLICFLVGFIHSPFIQTSKPLLLDWALVTQKVLESYLEPFTPQADAKPARGKILVKSTCLGCELNPQ